MKNSSTLHSIPISLLRQYIFCPRIPYFSEILGYRMQEPIWTEQGQSFHSELEKLIIRRIPEKFGFNNPSMEKRVNVVSEQLGLNGIVDFIFYNDTYVVPIEFKISGKKPTRGQELQLLAYGYALEEMKGLQFERGYFVMGSSKKPIAVFPNDFKRDEIINIRSSILQTYETMLMPESPASIHKCTQCEYLNLCNDRNF
ncbi:MAG: CRISPR-associated protein Cas4 [Leptospira sp.]|nr:CRISPR-associated protein Cas4 [Leptospira sp.]